MNATPQSRANTACTHLHARGQNVTPRTPDNSRPTPMKARARDRSPKSQLRPQTLHSTLWLPKDSRHARDELVAVAGSRTREERQKTNRAPSERPSTSARMLMELRLRRATRFDRSAWDGIYHRLAQDGMVRNVQDDSRRRCKTSWVHVADCHRVVWQMRCVALAPQMCPGSTPNAETTKSLHLAMRPTPQGDTDTCQAYISTKEGGHRRNRPTHSFARPRGLPCRARFAAGCPLGPQA